jgi:hypothetical protein
MIGGLGRVGRIGLSSPSKGGFSLAAFMASQSDGFWYDFGQTDRLFQEQCGPTPANDPNEVIGLALSSRLWGGRSFADYVASQPNIATQTSVNGVAIGGPTFTAYAVSPALTIGRCYEIKFTVTDFAGSNTVGITDPVGRFEPDLVGSNVPGNGSYVFYGTAQTTDALSLFTRAVNTCNFTNISIKEVSRYPATQATGSFKPTFQTTGAKFDGTDDNLLTGYLAQAAAGGNFLVARVTVPVTLAGTQIIAGTNDSGGADPFRLGITTAGALRATVGAGSTLDSTGIDLRGTETVVGLSYDGATVRTFAGSAQVGVFAETGAISTTVPFRLGARNDNGTAATFFAGSIDSILAGRQALDNARFNQIAAALMAA